MKKGDVGDDEEKVLDYMREDTQHYEEGYCIYNLEKNSYFIKAVKLENKVFKCKVFKRNEKGELEDIMETDVEK